MQARELSVGDEMMELRSRLRHALLTVLIQDPDAFLNPVQPASQVCLTQDEPTTSVARARGLCCNFQGRELLSQVANPAVCIVGGGETT